MTEFSISRMSFDDMATRFAAWSAPSGDPDVILMPSHEFRRDDPEIVYGLEMGGALAGYAAFSESDRCGSILLSSVWAAIPFRSKGLMRGFIDGIAEALPADFPGLRKSFSADAVSAGGYRFSAHLGLLLLLNGRVSEVLVMNNVAEGDHPFVGSLPSLSVKVASRDVDMALWLRDLSHDASEWDDVGNGLRSGCGVMARSLSRGDTEGFRDRAMTVAEGLRSPHTAALLARIAEVVDPSPDESPAP